MDRAGLINLVLSVAAILIALHADYNSYEQNKLTQTLNYLTIDPDVVTYFYYPDFNNSNSSPKTAVTNIGSIRIDALGNNSTSESPMIVVKNNGPISIVSLGVKHSFFSFNKVKNEIDMRAQMKDSVNDIGGEYVMFNKILNPKEFVFMPLLNAADEYDSYNKSYSILAYLFDIDYYRESDMKNYSMRAIYFVDNGKVYNEKDFLKNSYYQIIMKKIDSYNNMVPPDMQTFPPISFITENRGFGANANKN